LKKRMPAHFLDEIAELSAAPGKLLRVTQDGRFQRIGSTAKFTPMRAFWPRAIAFSTTKSERPFSRGLFYRLNVWN